MIETKAELAAVAALRPKELTGEAKRISETLKKELAKRRDRQQHKKEAGPAVFRKGEQFLIARRIKNAKPGCFGSMGDAFQQALK